MKKYFLSFALAAACMPLAAQFTQQVRGGNIQDAGITYMLPKNVLGIRVDAACTTLKAGPLAQFAEKYLGITDAPQEDATVWQITGIEVQNLAVADTSKMFHVSTAAAAQVPAIHLTDDGLLKSINCEVGGTVAAEVADGTPAAAKSALHAVNVMNEELLRAGSKNKQAEIAARQIFRIREGRQNLLTGDVDNYPADGASFQLVLDNLEAQEKALLELFLGVRHTTTEQRVLNYEPKRQAADEILFRFSRHYGFVQDDDLVGEAYTMTIEVLEDNTSVPVQTDAKGRVKPAATGIAYNVPGKLRYSIARRGESLASGVVASAQLGHVERLSATQFTDKKSPAKASFDLLTGNIKFYE